MTTTTKKTTTKKPTATKDSKGDNIVTLAQLCSPLKVDPVDARVRLRAAVKKGTIKHEARALWEWAKGSSAIAEVRKIIAGE